MKSLENVLVAKGVSKKKALGLANNKRVAITKKIRHYLRLNHIPSTKPYHMLKHKELLDLFLSAIGITHEGNLWEVVYDLYESGEYEFLRAMYVRNMPTGDWIRIRSEVFKIHGKVCLCCGSTEDIAVDHIKPYSLYPELSMDINNMQPLCRSCNSKKGNRRITDYRN